MTLNLKAYDINYGMYKLLLWYSESNDLCMFYILDATHPSTTHVWAVPARAGLATTESTAHHNVPLVSRGYATAALTQLNSMGMDCEQSLCKIVFHSNDMLSVVFDRIL